MRLKDGYGQRSQGQNPNQWISSKIGMAILWGWERVLPILRLARQVNSALVLLYWRVGRRIYEGILREKRAEYGEQIVATLSKQLMKKFDPGFTARNLANMIRFAGVSPHEKILHTLCAKLSWSHFVEIIPLKDDHLQISLILWKT